MFSHPITIHLIFILVVAWTAYRPMIGFCFLMVGLGAFSRYFAYVHIDILSKPIFITEAFLITAILRSLAVRLTRPRDLLESYRQLPNRKAWSVFYSVAALSLFRGLAAYPFNEVLRDAALVYYSLFALLVYAMPLDSKEIRVGLFGWMAIAVVKAVMVMGHALGDKYGMPLLHIMENPAASSLYFSTALLIAFAGRDRFSSRGLWFGVTWILFTGLIMQMVRSAWTALPAGYVVLLLCHWRLRRPSITRLLWEPALSMILACVFIFTVYPRFSAYRTYPVDIANKAESLLKFYKSPNVMTRWLLWEDAIGELSGTGLFKEKLEMKDLKKYEGMKKDAGYDSENNTITLNVRAKGHEDQHIVLKFGPDVGTSQSNKSKNPFMAKVQIIKKLIIGVPFGKPFYPPQVVYWLAETTRYDPHNSYVAILYRTGLVGLAGFVCLIAGFYKRVWARARAATQESDDYWLTLAILASATAVLVHALTDVTFENAFKGSLIWILIGLSMHLTRSQER